MTSASDSTHSAVTSDKNDKVELSVHLDADLIRQVSRLTNDPSKVIEVALRQWLRSDTPLERPGLSRVMPVNPPVPPKGEWND